MSLAMVVFAFRLSRPTRIDENYISVLKAINVILGWMNRGHIMKNLRMLGGSNFQVSYWSREFGTFAKSDGLLGLLSVLVSFLHLPQLK